MTQTQAAPPPRLRERYEQEILPALTEKFDYSTPMQAPRLQKITLNMGLGEAKQNDKMLEAAQEQLATIAGQQPNIRRARKSIASFKVREGMPVGLSVTLRRARMWEFLDRLCSIAVPRIRDFRGLNPRSFDGRGNYSMGVKEQLIFPEIDYDSIDEVRGLDMTITTSAQTDVEAFELLLGARHALRQGGPARRRRRGEAAEEEEEKRKEEARAKAEAEAGRAGAAQGGEPRGLRQARARGRMARRARATRAPETTPRARPSEENQRMAKTSQKVKQGRKPKFKITGIQPLPPLWPAACLLPQVRPLPNLPAGGSARGPRPRHDQVELVRTRC